MLNLIRPLSQRGAANLKTNQLFHIEGPKFANLTIPDIPGLLLLTLTTVSFN